MQSCFSEIKALEIANMLTLNDNKIDLMLVTSGRATAIIISNEHIIFIQSVENFIFALIFHCTTNDNVFPIVQTYNVELYNLVSICTFLTNTATETLVHDFIF